jgi:hypothetical protein
MKLSNPKGGTNGGQPIRSETNQTPVTAAPSHTLHTMQKKPLTGWLILLIVILGPLTFGQAGGTFTRLDVDYRPLLASYPSLLRALIVCKLLMGSSVCVSIYTAWVLYRRHPGSLGFAQAGLVVRAVLMIAANIALPMLAGFPPDVTQSSYSQLVGPSALVLLPTGVWYLYLISSKRVSEIYAA